MIDQIRPGKKGGGGGGGLDLDIQYPNFDYLTHVPAINSG